MNIPDVLWLVIAAVLALGLAASLVIMFNHACRLLRDAWEDEDWRP